MAIVPEWLPPTERGNYDTILFIWTLFPLAASLQWITGWYGMGKTSVVSRFNWPGKLGWMTMEIPGFVTLLYTMYSVSEHYGIEDLPWQNKVLAGLFVIHYSYRAILYPLMQPSLSPIHFIVWVLGLGFQVMNGTCLGAWLGGYGPTTREAWDADSLSTLRFVVGIALFYVGLAGNYIHDDELREIRRAEQRRQDRLHAQGHRDVAKIYRIPTAGLFRWILYPHYLFEWVEWFGFWIACGLGCVPARCFLVNEITTMLPRTVRGKRWYIERFGEDKIRKKWAVIPGVI